MYVCIGCPADYDGLDDDHDDCEPRVVTVEEATSNPCPASSASASSSAVWPPELRLWVERSFGQCRNNRDRGRAAARSTSRSASRRPMHLALKGTP